MKKLKEILLVDDSESTNVLNKRLLVKMEVVEKISTALHGQYAMEYLRSEDEQGNHPSPDIIFLDINMPVMDGYEFLEEYAKLREEMKAKKVVVMLTSSVSKIDIEKSKKYTSVMGYHFKPLTKEKVLEVIKEIS